MDMFQTLATPANPKHKGFKIAGGEVGNMTDDKAYIAALVERTLLGDNAAFNKLVDMHRHLIYRTACSWCGSFEDADDIFQEVFAAAFDKLGKLENPSTFSSWLWRILMNRLKNFHRTKKSRRMDMQRTIDDPEYPDLYDERLESDPERAFFAKKMRQDIERAIKGLRNDRQRQCYQLYFLEHETYSKIAKIVGIPIDRVRRCIYSGYKHMRPQLSMWEDENEML